MNQIINMSTDITRAKARETAIWLLMDLSDKMPTASVKDRVKEAKRICEHTKQALNAAKEPIENIRFWDEVSDALDRTFPACS